MKNKNDNKNKGVNNGELEAICKHISQRELNAQKAQRESIKYMQCLYLEDKINKVYKGIVTSVTDYGLFVTIDENGCDCLVKLSNLSGTWVADTENYRVKEYNTNDIIRLGDLVMVTITKVDIEKKNIDAMIIRL